MNFRKSRTQLIKLQQGSIISKNAALVSRLKCNCKVIGDKQRPLPRIRSRKSKYRPRPLPRVTTLSKYTYVEKKAHKLSLGGRRRGGEQKCVRARALCKSVIFEIIRHVRLKKIKHKQKKTPGPGRTDKGRTRNLGRIEQKKRVLKR